ncbi:hypothetical protein [Streptomyces sp. NPDC055109]
MRARTRAAIAVAVGVTVMTATSATGASRTPESAPESAPEHVPTAMDNVAGRTPLGGDTGSGDYRSEDGRIQINERSYSAQPGSCIAVVNVANAMLGATSFNIRNESRRTVEFFNGITCDTGAPVATVGPRSSSNAVPGLATGPVAGLPGDGIIVGSFRVRD